MWSPSILLSLVSKRVIQRSNWIRSKTKIKVMQSNAIFAVINESWVIIHKNAPFDFKTQSQLWSSYLLVTSTTSNLFPKHGLKWSMEYRIDPSLLSSLSSDAVTTWKGKQIISRRSRQMSYGHFDLVMSQEVLTLQLLCETNWVWSKVTNLWEKEVPLHWTHPPAMLKHYCLPGGQNVYWYNIFQCSVALIY